MRQETWQPYEQGQTIGTSGSEHGVILRDEEYNGGARITLERDGYTPFAINCGIYGWMVHTCFFKTEEAAQATYEEIKAELAHIVDMIPLNADPDVERKLPLISEEITPS
jgi:hypothetical protein